MYARLIVRIALCLGLAAGLAAPAAAQQTAFRPIVVVNDQAITGYDLQQRTLILSTLGAQAASEQALQRAALDALIEDRLKMQEGKRLGLSATPELMDQARAEIAERLNTTPDAMMALLANQGVGQTAIDDLVAAQAVWREVVRTRFNRRIEPSEAEIDAEMKLIRSSGETSFRLREIGLPAAEDNRGEAATRELADRIVAELAAGADFDEMVRRYSRSPSARRGGEIGWISEKNLPPDLVARLDAIEPGGVTQPVPVTGGFSILQVQEKRTEDGPDVDANDPETRERVRRALRAQQSQLLAEGLLQELRRDALIEFR